MESIRQMLISGEMQIGMSATILIALIIVTFKLSSYINNLNTKVNSNEKRIDKVEGNNDEMGKEHNLIKLTQAVLETKLENIEAGIVEIKTLLIKKK